MDTSFRTPAEVLTELDVPVLGSISLKHSDAHSGWNGNGNGNGGRAQAGEAGAAEYESTAYEKQGKL
jgi:hypothetical protein